MPVVAVPPNTRLRLAGASIYHRRRAQKYFHEFAPMIVRDDRGDLIDYADMHLAWCYHLAYCWANDLHCAIISHFGSGKSSGFAVPLSAWLLGKDPNLCVKYISHSDALARRAVSGAKTIIEDPEYKRIFPGVVPGEKWAEHEAFLVRSGKALDPSLHAMGVDSKGIGGRADVIVFDDVCDEKNTESEDVRRKIKLRVHRTWMSRRRHPRTSRVLWIATIWHDDDATSELLTLPGWCTLIQRVNADCSGLEQEVHGASADYLEWGSRNGGEVALSRIA